MAPKGAVQNIFGTQKVGGVEISPPLLNVGAQPSSPAPPPLFLS